MRAKLVKEAFERGQGVKRSLRVGTTSRVKQIVEGTEGLKWIDTENRNALVEIQSAEALNKMFEELDLKLPDNRSFYEFKNAIEEIYYSTFVVIDGQLFAKRPEDSFVLIQIDQNQNWRGYSSKGEEMSFEELEEWHGKIAEEE